MNLAFGIETLQVGPLETNCYIVWDPGSMEALVVDPGSEGGRIVKAALDRKLSPKTIVNTHGHADHTGANVFVKEAFGAKIFIHENDEAFLSDPSLNGSNLLPSHMHSASRADVLLRDGSEIKIGDMTFRVIHTPGHTPGGICLASAGIMFTGDTLFRGDIGRSDLPGGDEEELMKSLKVFLRYPPETVIYPGHGPKSTLGREFAENQYLT